VGAVGAWELLERLTKCEAALIAFEQATGRALPRPAPLPPAAAAPPPLLLSVEADGCAESTTALDTLQARLGRQRAVTQKSLRFSESLDVTRINRDRGPALLVDSSPYLRHFGNHSGPAFGTISRKSSHQKSIPLGACSQQGEQIQ